MLMLMLSLLKEERRKKNRTPCSGNTLMQCTRVHAHTLFDRRRQTLDLASAPEDLPAENEALILQNSSTQQVAPTPTPQPQPQPRLPRGVPVGGVAVDLLRATRLGLQNSGGGGGGGGGGGR